MSKQLNFYYVMPYRDFPFDPLFWESKSSGWSFADLPKRFSDNETSALEAYAKSFPLADQDLIIWKPGQVSNAKRFIRGVQNTSWNIHS